jgi:phage shock protein PspC (stress-responsive transcriptional regulator)
MRDRLYRSKKDRIIGGVCSGLAEYFGIDPVIVRIIFAVLVIGKGVGLLAYIILWIVVPEEPIEHYYARFNQNRTPNQSSGTSPEGENQPADSASGTGIDNQPQGTNYEFYPPARKNSGGLVFGIILILIGLLFLFWNIIPSFDLELFFPLVCLIVGVFLIINSIKK